MVSPCTLAERQGAVTRGQKPSKRGYVPVRLRYRRGVLPHHDLRHRRARTAYRRPLRRGHRPGFRAAAARPLLDALARGKKVIALVAEVFGGLSPQPATRPPARSLPAAASLRAWPPNTPPARDSKQAPSTPARCARSFRQYHGQRISHAIVMTDALNIHEVIQKSIYLSILSILKLKKLTMCDYVR